MNRELWRKRWLFSIDDITSCNLQRNSLNLLTKNGVYWPLADFVCYHFNEVLSGYDFEFYKDDLLWISQDEFNIIKSWHSDLEKFMKRQNNENALFPFFSYGQWLIIQRSGLNAKERLRLILPEFEKNLLS